MNCKKNKKHINKKIDDKVTGVLDKAIEKQSIRKDKYIWFWLILFPPIGLYKAIKYKAFNKITIGFISILMILTLLLGVDNILYPNRVIDSKMQKAIEKYADIGTLRSYTKQGNLDDNFFIYNVVTTTGEYDIYFSGDGKLVIEGINQLSPKREMVYKSNNIPKEYENIYPEIIRFFNEEDIVKKYGNIKGYEDSEMENHQIIITDKGKYSINVEYGQVVALFNINEDGELEKSMQRNAKITLPDDISKILSKNEKTIGAIKEVYAYKVTDQTIEYYFLNEKHTHYKVVKYLDGKIEILVGSSTLHEESDSCDDDTHEHSDDEEHEH